MAYGWPNNAAAMYCPSCLAIVWLNELHSIYYHLVHIKCMLEINNEEA